MLRSASGVLQWGLIGRLRAQSCWLVLAATSSPASVLSVVHLAIAETEAASTARGAVSGDSTLARDETVHGFLWQKGRMVDLGALSLDHRYSFRRFTVPTSNH